MLLPGPWMYLVVMEMLGSNSSCHLSEREELYSRCVLSGFAFWPGVSKGVKAAWDQREGPLGHIQHKGWWSSASFLYYLCGFFFHITRAQMNII